jgi:DNA-binding transcriptional LysR family regulator
MDLRHLRYFLAVADEMNISRAAARLFISQPPLTRQIRALEDELGVRLFVRTAKGVELTQAGEMFKVEATNIRMMIEAGIDRTRRVSAGKLGRLDIAIFGSAIYDTVPKLLQKFQSKLPDVSIVLHTMDKNEQIEALRQRRITVGFNRLISPPADIGQELVATERLLVVLPQGHQHSGRKAVPFRALADFPMVLFPNVGRPNFVDHMIGLSRQQGFEPNIAQVVGDAITGIALVARGFGITVIPESAASSFRFAGTVYLPFADAPQAVVDISCLYRASDQSPLLHSFLTVVREYRKSAPSLGIKSA